MVMVTQKCFQQIQNLANNPADYWVVMQRLSALSVSKESRASLAKHIGPDSQYSQKALVVNLLGAILDALDVYPTGSRKKELQNKLRSAFKEKSPKALHLYLNALMLLAFDRPKSIDAFLQRLRLDTLGTLVNPDKHNIFEWDEFANAAANYGVKPLVEHGSAAHKLEAKKHKALTKAFEETYPEDIVGDLFKCVRREIGIYYGYVGEKAEGFGAADCHKIKAFLEQLFETSIEYTELFRFNADRPIDINWLFIHKALCLKLQQGDKPFLIFTEEEKQLLEIIHNPVPQDISPDKLESLISTAPGVFASYVYILYSHVLPVMLVDTGITPVQQNNLLQMANSYPLELSENICQAWVTANHDQITTEPDALKLNVKLEFLRGLRMLPSSKLRTIFYSLPNPGSLLFLAAKNEPALLGELLKILPEQDTHALKGLFVTLLENNPQALIPTLEVVATLHPTIQISLLGDPSFLDKLLNQGSHSALTCLVNVVAKHSAEFQEAILCSQKDALPLLLKIMRHYPQLLGTFLQGMHNLIPSVQMQLWMAFCEGETPDLGKFPLNPLVLAARDVNGPELVLQLLKEIGILCKALSPPEKEILLRNLWLLEGIKIADQDAKYTPLMMALHNSHRLILRELFGGMVSLPKEIRDELFCATTGGEINNNVLGVLVECPHSLLHCKDLVAAVSNLDPLFQMMVWGHRNGKDKPPLQIMEQKLPVQRVALRSIRGFEFTRRVKLLEGTARLERARDLAIQNAISTVSTAKETPLEAVIGLSLRSMTVNADDKIVAILIALLTLKNKHQEASEEKIAEAALNEQSKLYAAVNHQRFFPFSRSRTLKNLQQAVRELYGKDLESEGTPLFEETQGL